MLKSKHMVTFGIAATLAGAVIVVLVPRLLPLFLESGLVFSLLLRIEDLGQLLAFVGILLSSAALVQAWRHGSRATLLLAAIGIVIGVLVLAPLLFAMLLGWAMGRGGGIPR